MLNLRSAMADVQVQGEAPGESVLLGLVTLCFSLSIGIMTSIFTKFGIGTFSYPPFPSCGVWCLYVLWYNGGSSLDPGSSNHLLAVVADMMLVIHCLVFR